MAHPTLSQQSRLGIPLAAAVALGLLAGAVRAEPGYSGTWDFETAAGLTFDPAAIEVAEGTARLRAQRLPTHTGVQLNILAPNQLARIEHGAQSGLDVGTGSYLFLAWVNLRTLSASHALFQKRGIVHNATRGILFQVENGPSGLRLRASLATATASRDYPIHTLIRRTGWHQVGVAIDRVAGKLTYYLNGQPYETTSITDITGSLDNTGPFQLGLDDTQARLRGDLDQVTVWKYAGSLPAGLASIVRAHFDGEVTDLPAVVSSWRFDTGNGTDSVGSNHLTMVGSPTYPLANIQRVPTGGPYVESDCVAGPGSAWYSADHLAVDGGPVEVRYQLSSNGVDWWYHAAGTGWTQATGNTADQASLMHQVRENLPDAPFAGPAFCFRAFLLSDGLLPAGVDRLEVLAPPASLAVRAPPVAGRPAPGRFDLLFETDYPAEAFVEFRPAVNPGAPWSATPVVQGGAVLDLAVPGLTPGAAYDYRVRYRPRGTQAEFQATAVQTLPVAPAAGTPAGPLQFAVWGDSRPHLGEAAQPPVFYQLMEKVAAEGAAFHIPVGDNVNLTGAQPFALEDAIGFYRGWRDAYDLAAGQGYLFFEVGNHDEEFAEPLRSVAAAARLRATLQPADGDPAQRYYSWRWGDALFVVMDGTGDPRPAQTEWVIGKLQEPARWKFVFNHLPFFNSDRGIGNLATRDQLHAAFRAAGVNIVFQAHDHWYADTVVDGIHYTTTGGAGSPLRPGEPQFNPIVDYHYLRVRMEGASTTVEAVQVREDGAPGALLGQYCVPARDAPAGNLDGDAEPDACDPDDDGDGVPDAADNCRVDANADQRDSNGDGFGNLCDADLDEDGFVNFSDLARLRQVFGTGDPHADLTGDGVVNFADLARFRALFGKPPGPAGN